MSLLERQIAVAKRRLWLNRWLAAVGWGLTVSSLAFALLFLFQRLYEWPLPLLWVAVGFLAVAALGAAVWTTITRESDIFAAARLDEAAGLRERVSSGHFCLPLDDPFAQAVVADAERVCGSITVGKHLRLVMPRSLGFSLGSLVLVAAMFLVPLGVLKKAGGTPTGNPAAEVESTKIAVKKQLDAVRQFAEESPVLAELKDDLQRLDTEPAGRLERPADVRHEAVKKIEALADAVKEKRGKEEYESLPALERRLRGLRTPEGADAMTEKLTKSLREGDFKTAKEEINALKEQLATLKTEQDKEMAQKLGQQLDNLAKQLEQLAKDEKLTEKLEQAGITKEDAQRMLENLKKEDLEQLQKQLAEKGMNQQQVRSLTNQLQQQRQAGGKCHRMAQAMKQSAQAAAAGKTGEAAAGLTQAGEQLSELEQMQQEMVELDSTLQTLQAAKDNLDQPCSQCQGSGMQNGQPCSKCQGNGSEQGGQGGMGPKIGQGRGGLAPEQESATGFKVERAKVTTGKGAIIGQFQVDGEQLRGETTSQLTELVEAAERDASDRIQRDRIPRQYQKAIKSYFSNVHRKLDGDKKKGAAADPQPPADNQDAKPAPESTEKPAPSDR